MPLPNSRCQARSWGWLSKQPSLRPSLWRCSGWRRSCSRAQIEAETETILKPAVSAKLLQLSPADETGGNQETDGADYLRLRVPARFAGRSRWVHRSCKAGRPSMNRVQFMDLINVHPGNDELDFVAAASHAKCASDILGPRLSRHGKAKAIQWERFPLSRRCAETATRKADGRIVEKHKVKQASAPRSQLRLRHPPTPPAASAPAAAFAASHRTSAGGARVHSPTTFVSQRRPFARRRRSTRRWRREGIAALALDCLRRQIVVEFPVRPTDEEVSEGRIGLARHGHVSGSFTTTITAPRIMGAPSAMNF